MPGLGLTLTEVVTRGVGGGVPSPGGGGAPAWFTEHAPAGAIAAVSWMDGAAYFDGALYSLADVHTDLNPAAVSGAGMAVLTGNGNRPFAAGPFLASLCQSFLVVCDVTNAVPVAVPGSYREFLAISEGPWLEAGNYFDSAINGNSPYHGGVAGGLNTGAGVGSESAIIQLGANRIAMQVSYATGTIVAANGDSSGSDSFPFTPSPAFDTAQIGWYDGDDSCGDLTWRRMFFLAPDKTLAQVKALSVAP